MTQTPKKAGTHYEIVRTTPRGNSGSQAEDFANAMKKATIAIFTYAAKRFAIYEADKKSGARRPILHAAKIRGKWVVL